MSSKHDCIISLFLFLDSEVILLFSVFEDLLQSILMFGHCGHRPFEGRRSNLFGFKNSDIGTLVDNIWITSLLFVT